LRHIHHQVVALRITQLVADQRHREIVLRTARPAALQRDDLQSGLSEFLREDAAGPAHADDDDINGSKFGCHGARSSQYMSAMLTGLAAKRRPSLYCFTFSALLAITPGKPSIAQPILSLLPP